MEKNESHIGLINFFDKNGGLLYRMGTDSDSFKGRKEIFHIADNERLIGCELDYGQERVHGITFIKWKIDF